jgi:hypothetical protein
VDRGSRIASRDPRDDRPWDPDDHINADHQKSDSAHLAVTVKTELCALCLGRLGLQCNRSSSRTCRTCDEMKE